MGELSADNQKLSALEKLKRDEDFLKDLKEILDQFLQSDKPYIRLRATNAYFRHITHNLVKDLGLNSISQGEGLKRHIVVYRAGATAPQARVPKSQANNPGKLDQREFLVAEFPAGTEIVLTKSGFVGLRLDYSAAEIVDSKLIKSGAFKILANRIIEL